MLRKPEANMKRFIFLLLALAISVFSIAGSVASFSSYEKLLCEQVYTSSLDALTQISYLNTIIEDTSNALVSQLLTDNGLIYLMTARQRPEQIEELSHIQRLCAYRFAAPFVHSIYLINGENNIIYSTTDRRIYQYDNFFDQEVFTLLRENRTGIDGIVQRIVPRETPLGYDAPSYTYLYRLNYYASSLEKDIPSSICVNINSSWITDVMSDMDAVKQSDLLIVDNTGRIIAQTAQRCGLPKADYSIIAARVHAQESARGYFVDETLSEDCLVSYLYEENTRCQLVRVLPYKEISAPVRAMRTLALRVACLMLLAGVLLALVLSRRLYRPFFRMQEANRQLHTERSRLAVVEQQALLRSYLTTPVRSTPARRSPPWSAYAERVVLLVTARSANPINISALDEAIRRTLGTEIHVWLSDAVGKTYPFVFAATPAQLLDTVREALENARSALEAAAEAELLLALSDTQPCDGRLAALFEQASDLIHYRIFYEDRFLLTTEVLENRTAQIDFTAFRTHETQLNLYLSAGETDKAKDLLNKMLTLCSCDVYHNFLNRMLYLAIVTFNTLNALESSVNGTVTSHMEAFTKELNACNSIQEISEAFFSRFDEISTLQEVRRSAVRADRTQETVDTVMQTIREHYGDPNLSQATIADSLGRSSAHLGRLFKSTYGVSISACIMSVRIESAKQLLTATDKSVSEIAEEVGFANANYFYTCFKHETGITPSVYRAGSSSQ